LLLLSFGLVGPQAVKTVEWKEMPPSGNKKGSLLGSCPIPVYVFVILNQPLLLLAFDFIAFFTTAKRFSSTR
jgi:hypothetical protein